MVGAIFIESSSFGCAYLVLKFKTIAFDHKGTEFKMVTCNMFCIPFIGLNAVVWLGMYDRTCTMTNKVGFDKRTRRSSHFLLRVFSPACLLASATRSRS